MTKVSVLAGCPIAKVENGEVVVPDAQLLAFKEAMIFTASIRDQIGRVVMAFDHPGIFSKLFLDPSQKISGEKSRRGRLNLTHTHPNIRSFYAEIAADYGVNLAEISVVTEDLCRLLVTENTKDRRVYAMRKCHEKGDCSLQDDNEILDKLVVNCRGLTAAIIKKVARDTDEVHTFWEFDEERVNPTVIEDGTKLAYELFGVRANVFQSMLVPARIMGKDRYRQTTFTFNVEKRIAETKSTGYEELK